MKAVDLFAGAGGWSLACQNLDIDEVGVVTVPEAGVIQDFPVDYKWQGSRTKQFLQVGNAIPVKMAEAILRTVI